MSKCEGDTYIPGDMFCFPCAALPTKMFRGRHVCAWCENNMKLNEAQGKFTYEDRTPSPAEEQ